MAVPEMRTETVTLSQPVEAHGEEVTELTFREPTGRDLVAGGKATNDDWDVRVIASCCGVPPSTILGMVARDVNKLMRVYSGFLGAPKAPASSSDTSTPGSSGATSDTSST